MKKLSAFISILFVALALVSCAQGYSPVAPDGFTSEQSEKIEALLDVEAKVANAATASPLPQGITLEGSTETNDLRSYWIKSIIKSDESYVVDPSVTNVKYTTSTDSTTYFYKKNSTTALYTFDELEDDGYVTIEDGRVVPDFNKMRAELKMKMNIKSTITAKDSTSGTTSILKYDVNVIAEGTDTVTFVDGWLSIDLGDGKGAIGSNDKKDIAAFFEMSASE